MSTNEKEFDNLVLWAMDIPQNSAKQVLSDDKQNMYTLKFWLGDNKFIVYYGDGEANGYDERPLPDVDSPPRLQPRAQEAWDIFSERLRTEAIQVSFLNAGHLYEKTKDDIAEMLVAATPETWDKKWWKIPGEFHRVRGNSSDELRTIFIGNAPSDIDNHSSGTYSSKDSTDFLTGAILATFLDFNPRVQYDTGDITKLVWWRYKEATRRCAEITRLVKSQLEKIKHEIEQERQQTCNDADLQRFNEWLNPEYGDYGADLAIQGIRFSTKTETSFTVCTTHKVPYCEMENLLLCLNKHGAGEKTTPIPSYLFPSGLTVIVTVECPEVNSTGISVYPQIGFSTTKCPRCRAGPHPWWNFQENEQNGLISMQICGLLTVDGEVSFPLTLILPETMDVRMKLPKEFSKFEYLNTAPTQTLQKCRRIPPGTKITNIKVYINATHRLLEFVGVTKNHDEIKTWRNERKRAIPRSNLYRYYYPFSPTSVYHLKRKGRTERQLFAQLLGCDADELVSPSQLLGNSF